jgi:hypothetical protein
MSLGLIIAFAPLLIGIWFAFLPETVPGWVLVVPMFLFDIVSRLFIAIAVDRSSENYDNTNQQMVGSNMNTNPSAEPGTVRIVGMVLLVLWFLCAVVYKRRVR